MMNKVLTDVKRERREPMSSVSPTILEIPMPQAGVSTDEGTITQWLIAVGDTVEIDQPICEIESDKVIIEALSPAAGTIVELLVNVDERVAVGAAIAHLATNGGTTLESKYAAAAEPAAEQPAPPPARNESLSNVHGFSPVVRRMAHEHGLDLKTITGTGRRGRVTKRDVEAALAAAATSASASAAAPASASVATPASVPVAAPAPIPVAASAPRSASKGVPARPQPMAPARSHAAPLSRMRQSIARSMLASKATAPHTYTWMEVDFSRVEAGRRDLGVTALAYVARASVEALQAHPAVNAWLHDDMRTLHDDVHLGIAVALDDDGLVVPVIHNAQDLSVQGLATRIRELATKARASQLTPEDVQGATFTITNPGRYGTLMAAVIINQPQVAILDMEGIAKRPVVITDEHGNDSLGIRPIAVLGLTWDHRALDGVLAAKFLATLRDRLQSVRS